MLVNSDEASEVSSKTPSISSGVVHGRVVQKFDVDVQVAVDLDTAKSQTASSIA